MPCSSWASKSSHSFQVDVNSKDKLPNSKRLWSNFVQEEIKRNTRDGDSARNDEEENFVLASKGKKSKGKKA